MCVVDVYVILYNLKKNQTFMRIEWLVEDK